MYRGNISVSASGYTCRFWYNTNYSFYVPPQSKNYCRNPTGAHDKPWCAISINSFVRESCKVSKCVRPTIAKSSYPLGSKYTNTIYYIINIL